MVRVRAAAAVAAALAALAGGGWAAPAHAAPPAPPSTTVLTLSSPTTAYGDAVTFTAQVSTPGGSPQGDVVFTLDGTPIKANLLGNGSASTVVRASAIGQHTVTATFDPQFDDQQQPSTSPAQTWVVTSAGTGLQVRVTGRGVRIPTSVVVVASGEYGTRPTGAVTVTVRRLASGRVVSRERTLDGAGTAVARFGTLRAGGYRLRVAYAGDAQHLAERYSQKFAVRQR